MVSGRRCSASRRLDAVEGGGEVRPSHPAPLPVVDVGRRELRGQAVEVDERAGQRRAAVEEVEHLPTPLGVADDQDRPVGQGGDGGEVVADVGRPSCSSGHGPSRRGPARPRPTTRHPASASIGAKTSNVREKSKPPCTSASIGASGSPHSLTARPTPLLSTRPVRSGGRAPGKLRVSSSPSTGAEPRPGPRPLGPSMPTSIDVRRPPGPPVPSPGCPPPPTRPPGVAPSPSSATPTRARPPSPRSSCSTAGRSPARPARSRPAPAAGRRPRTGWRSSSSAASPSPRRCCSSPTATASSTCSTPRATATSPRTPTGCWPPPTPRSWCSTRPRASSPRPSSCSRSAASASCRC